jgi:hypothetical protein
MRSFGILPQDDKTHMEDQTFKEQPIHPITEALYKLTDKLNPVFLKFSETKEKALSNLRTIGQHARPLSETI